MGRAKKGGPKKKDGERYKCGLRIQPVDYGTPEQRLKREIAAGRLGIREDEKWSDALARMERGTVPLSRTGTEALDVLLGRRIIDRDQFEVALDFAACWSAYIGRPWPKGWQAERQAPDHDGGLPEKQLQRMKVRYWNCIAAMDITDRTIYPLVRDVVIHGKVIGLIQDVLSFDVVRQDCEGGGIVARKYGVVAPSLKARIDRLTRGIDIIGDTRRGDYTREAEAMIAKLRERDHPLTSP